MRIDEQPAKQAVPRVMPVGFLQREVRMKKLATSSIVSPVPGPETSAAT